VYIKYQCNYNFFDNIDTESKAYWLGFITADGFRKFLVDNGIVTKSKISWGTGIWNIRFNGVGLPISVINLLYDKATIYLDRKKELADHVRNAVKSAEIYI
jgi:hypothetical protein